MNLLTAHRLSKARRPLTLPPFLSGLRGAPTHQWADDAAERRYTNGGLLRTYDFLWDADDRLRAIREGPPNRFTASYDGGGLRVNKWDAWTGTHDFSWGPGGVLYDSSGDTTYTAGLAHRAGTVDRFYHSDWLGSTRYTSDSTGVDFPAVMRYDAFGNRTATGGVDP